MYPTDIFYCLLKHPRTTQIVAGRRIPNDIITISKQFVVVGGDQDILFAVACHQDIRHLLKNYRHLLIAVRFYVSTLKHRSFEKIQRILTQPKYILKISIIFPFHDCLFNSRELTSQITPKSWLNGCPPKRLLAK